MSKSRANELLQKLVQEITALWNGEKSEITATKAYEVCAEIARESADNRCLYCNNIIPEGKQICSSCEKELSQKST